MSVVVGRQVFLLFMEENHEIEFQVFEKFIEQIAATHNLGINHINYGQRHWKNLESRLDVLVSKNEGYAAPKANTIKGYFHIVQPGKTKYGKVAYSEKLMDTLSLFIGSRSYREFYDKKLIELGCQNMPIDDLVDSFQQKSKGASDDTYPLKDYLNWLVTRYSNIQLPSLGTKLNIPLERVYVALKVERKVNSYERESAKKNFERKFRERLAELNHRPTLHEEMEIQAELLREYPKMRSLFQDDQIQPVFEADHTLFDNYSTEKIITLAEAFIKHRYLVILGAPGSGKSTLSKWLVIQLAKSFLKSLEVSALTKVLVPSNQVNVFEDRESTEKVDIGPIRLPVFVKVSEYAEACVDSTISLLEYMKKNSSFEPFEEIEQPGELIEHYVKTGRAVVILDGIDEVPSQLKTKVQNQIQKFIDTWIVTNGTPTNFDPDILLEEPGEAGGNQILITSRIVGYQNFGLSGNITEVTIQEMEKPAVEHFCSIWMKHVHLLEAKTDMDRGTITEEEVQLNAERESNDLKKAIFDDRKPRIRELATNPLLVTFLAVIFRNNRGFLPESRVELYRSAYEILVHKWRKTPISRLELDQIMPVIASYIHQSPYDYITANELEEKVKEGLRITRGKDFDIRDVEALINAIKEDVGLLAEDGVDLFKFLHRTFQEYLAGIYLVSDDQKASDNIIEKLADPIWREPILLGLGFIDAQWSTQKKDSLINQLLEAHDPLKDLVPRASLFIALALGEMEKVSDRTVESIFEELITTYHQNQHKYKYQALNGQIEKALQGIYKGTKKDVLLSLIHKYLQRKELIPSISYLISRNQWINRQILKKLIELWYLDSNDLSFPIDQILRSCIGGPDAIYKEEAFESLLLKKHLIQTPSLIRVIAEDAGWSRLIISLYGGLSDLQIAEKASEFDRMQQMLRQGIGTNEELHAYAIKLDTESGPVHAKLNTAPTFSPYYIYRDSLFSKKIIQLLRQGVPSTAIQSYFVSFVSDKNEEANSRGLALLGLLVTGFDIEKLVADLDQSLDPNSQAILDFFVSELNRVKISLKDSIVRSSHIIRNHKSGYGNDFFGSIPMNIRGSVLRNLMEIYIENGSSPINISYQIVEQRIAEFEDIADQAYMESEGWAYRFSMHGEDSVYNIAVILDTIGKTLKNPFDVFIHSFSNIHNAKNLKWVGHVGWIHNSLPPFPESETYLILNALENIEGISNNYDFFKDWFFWSIGSKVSPDSDLFPEVIIRKLKNAVHDRDTELIEAFDSKDKLDDFLLNRSLKINDPYLRFRAIWQLAQYSFETHTDEPLIKAYYSIKNAHDFVLASELILKSSSESKIIIGISIIDDVNYQIGNIYSIVWQNAWNKTLSIDHPQNKVKSQIRLAGLSDSGISLEYLTEIVNGISQLPEKQKAELILEVKSYLKDHHIEGIDLRGQIDSISDEWVKNECSTHHSRNFLKIDHLFPGYNESWAALSLYQLCKDELESLENQAGQHLPIRSWLFSSKPEQLAKTVSGQQFEHKLSAEDVHYINGHVLEFGTGLITRLSPYLCASDSPIVIQGLRKLNTSTSSELRLLSSLLLAENGELDEVIITDLLQHINFSEDKIRNRAAIALHGLNTSSDKTNRRWRVSKIGLETLKFIYNQFEYYHSKDDHASTSRLAWFFSELIVDDPEAIEALISGGESSDADLRLTVFILRRIEMITPAVWKIYKKGLNSERGEVQEALFRSTCAMIHLSSPSQSSHFPSDAMNDLQEVIQFLPDQFFIESKYFNHTTQAILETLEKQYSNNSQVVLDFFESYIQELTKIDLRNIKSLNVKPLIDTLSRIGEIGFVRTGDVIRNARIVAQEVKDKPNLAKILLEWTMFRLQEDLLDNSLGDLGATLCIALSEYANLCPEQFVDLTDDSSIGDFFVTVAREHPRWVARRGAITIISHLSDCKPIAIETIATSLKDVPFVCEGALNAFLKFKKVFDYNGLELLKRNLKSNSALIASEAAKLIAIIAKSEEQSRELRELAIKTLSDELRETKKDVLPRQIWVVDKQFSSSSRHCYLGDYEHVLYSELIKVSGID